MGGGTVCQAVLCATWRPGGAQAWPSQHTTPALAIFHCHAGPGYGEEQPVICRNFTYPVPPTYTKGRPFDWAPAPAPALAPAATSGARSLTRTALGLLPALALALGCAALL